MPGKVCQKQQIGQYSNSSLNKLYPYCVCRLCGSFVLVDCLFSQFVALISKVEDLKVSEDVATDQGMEINMRPYKRSLL